CSRTSTCQASDAMCLSCNSTILCASSCIRASRRNACRRIASILRRRASQSSITLIMNPSEVVSHKPYGPGGSHPAGPIDSSSAQHPAPLADPLPELDARPAAVQDPGPLRRVHRNRRLWSPPVPGPLGPAVLEPLSRVQLPEAPLYLGPAADEHQRAGHPAGDGAVLQLDALSEDHALLGLPADLLDPPGYPLGVASEIVDLESPGAEVPAPPTRVGDPPVLALVDPALRRAGHLDLDQTEDLPGHLDVLGEADDVDEGPVDGDHRHTHPHRQHDPAGQVGARPDVGALGQVEPPPGGSGDPLAPRFGSLPEHLQVDGGLSGQPL